MPEYAIASKKSHQEFGLKLKKSGAVHSRVGGLGSWCAVFSVQHRAVCAVCSAAECREQSGGTRVTGGVGSRAIARGEPGERDHTAFALPITGYSVYTIYTQYIPYIPLYSQPGERDHTALLCL